MVVGEVLGTQSVVESSVGVPTLNYATYAVALEARSTVRVNYDAMISRLRVVDGGALVVTRNTRDLAIDRVEALATEVVLQGRANELNLTVNEGFDASFATPTVVLQGTTRRVTNTPLLCGGALLVAGVGEKDGRDVCAALGIATHRCVYDAAADVWMVDGHRN